VHTIQQNKPNLFFAKTHVVIAATLALQKKLRIIAGGPGTGKSIIRDVIIRMRIPVQKDR
jgi:hypothetical protein